MRIRALALAAAILPLAMLAAGPAAPATAQDVSFQEWGIRAGAADDPDQFLVGAHANFGELIPNLRLQPSLEVGFGDDHQTLIATVPAFYRFPVDGLTLYGGGGLALGVDRDDIVDETEFIISPALAGGIEWPAATGDLFLELGLLTGDLPNVKLVVGWTF